MLVFDTSILKCQQLKYLTLFNLNGFDGYFIRNFSHQHQLKSINLQNLKTWQNTYESFELNVGRHKKSLILRDVYVEVNCDSEGLCNLPILKLRLRNGCENIEFLAFVGNKLKHLQVESNPAEKIYRLSEINWNP